PGYPALSAANSLLYGNLPVSLVIQIVVVGEKVVVTVSPSAGTPPSSPPGNASRLLPPQRSNDAEHSPSSDLRAGFRLASYRQRPRRPAVPPPAEGLLFSLASTGKLGTGAFEFRVHDPSDKLKNIELPEGTVLEPLNMGVPRPAAAPGGSDITKSL